MSQSIDDSAINTMELYCAIGPIGFHTLKQNGFIKFPTGHGFKFYPRNYDDYAALKAKEISAVAEKGYVMRTKIKVKCMTFIPFCHVSSDDDYMKIDAGRGLMRRGYHGEYRLNAVHLNIMNTNIVGKIHVSKVFWDGEDITEYVCYGT